MIFVLSMIIFGLLTGLITLSERRTIAKCKQCAGDGCIYCLRNQSL